MPIGQTTSANVIPGPKTRVDLIDRRIGEVTSRLDAICTLVTIDS
jgi:hypothetical protein